MNTAASATVSSSVSPADFGDPTALNVGEWRGVGTIKQAAEGAIQSLNLLSVGFPDVSAVQFSFNGTPAVAYPGDDHATVHRDWNDRRTAYQKAAGIVA